MKKITYVGKYVMREIIDRYYQTSRRNSDFYLVLPDPDFTDEDEEDYLETCYRIYTYSTTDKKEWYIAKETGNVANWMGSNSLLINQCFS
jgi:hypothetical protein